MKKLLLVLGMIVPFSTLAAEPANVGKVREDFLTAVEEGQPLASEQDCVLHEVLHHVEYAMKLDVPEEIVEKFASCLLAVLKDNPTLVTYLRQREK